MTPIPSPLPLTNSNWPGLGAIRVVRGFRVIRGRQLRRVGYFVIVIVAPASERLGTLTPEMLRPVSVT